MPFNLTDAISGIELTDNLATAVHKAVVEDPVLAAERSGRRPRSAMAAGGGGGDAGGGDGASGAELRSLRAGVTLLGGAGIALLLAVTAMLGATLAQLAALQETLAQQGDSLDRCFESLLGGT